MHKMIWTILSCYVTRKLPNIVKIMTKEFKNQPKKIPLAKLEAIPVDSSCTRKKYIFYSCLNNAYILNYVNFFIIILCPIRLFFQLLAMCSDSMIKINFSQKKKKNLIINNNTSSKE